MHTTRDQPRNLYIDVENIRVTWVRASDRRPNTNWASGDVLRFQAYQNGRDGSLRPGPELGLGDDPVLGLLCFVTAVTRLWAEIHDSSSPVTADDVRQMLGQAKGDDDAGNV